MVLDNLASALEVEKVVVENAIATTADIIAEANRLAEAKRETAWRESGGLCEVRGAMLRLAGMRTSHKPD